MTLHYVYSGSVSSFEELNPGDNIIAYAGGTVFGVFLKNGSTLDVRAGATIGNRIDVGSGGTLKISGIMEADPFILPGGVLNIAATAQPVSTHGVNLNGGTVNMGKLTQIWWNETGGTVNVQAGVTYSCSEHIWAGKNILNVLSGASLGNYTMSAGNSATVAYGASIVAQQTLLTDVTLDIAGTIAASVFVSAGATAIVRQGATQAGGTFALRGGVVSTYQHMNFNWYGAGTTLFLESGAVYSAGNTMVAGANKIVVNGGATLHSATIPSQNTISVNSGGTIRGGSVASAATVAMQQGASIADTVNLANGASLTLWNNAGGSVNLLGSTNNAVVISGLENGGTLSTRILGFDGANAGNSDAIRIAGLSTKNVQAVTFPTADSVLITLKTGQTISLNIPGAQAAGYSISDSGSNLVYEVCYLPGCMVDTPRGEVPIEVLKEGDEVFAFDPNSDETLVRKIVWAGKGSGFVRGHLSDDNAGYPVRIRKNALGENTPSADMLVTSEHCIFVEGRAFPARMLVNGVSILYDRDMPQYDYHHIELDDHLALRVNNILAESYLDTGNRRLMKDGQATSSVTTLSLPRSARLELQASPAIAEHVWRQIVDRLDSQEKALLPSAPSLVMEPDLHLVTDRGELIAPHAVVEGAVHFSLPENASRVRILSRTARPCDTRGVFYDDRRELGVCIGAIVLRHDSTALPIDSHLRDNDLAGWHGLENADARWTSGNAVLTLPDTPSGSARDLSLQILGAGPYLEHITRSEFGTMAA